MADRMGESWEKLWAVVRREYLERVRTKWFIISTLFGPLLIGAFMVVPIMLSVRDAQRVAHRVIVLDATGSGLGRYVGRALRGATAHDSDSAEPDVQQVTPATLPTAERSATQDVVRRLATGYVVLDSGVLHGTPVRYAGRRSDSQSEMTRITDAVRAGLIALDLQRYGLSPATVDTVASIPTPSVRSESINDAGRSTATLAKTLVAGFVAFFLYMSIILYGQSMLSGVIEEKMTRVAEIVISSVSPDILLAGKVLGIVAVGLTQQIVWVVGSIAIAMARGAMMPAATAHAAAQSNQMGSTAFMDAVLATPLSWVAAVVLFFLLGFVFYGALYAAVGATVGSEQDARQAAQPVVLLLVFTALFISPVMQNPASHMARVISLIPFSAPIIMPLRMALTDVPLLEVVGSIVILAASCVAAVWLAARIYRVGLLMYGKRPTIRELRRWIVQA